jgi:hypothetical protein
MASNFGLVYKEIKYRLIKPKIDTVVLPKQALDPA